MIIFTIISTATLDKEERNLFGVRAYAVLSDSMSATDFDAGDIVFVRTVDPASLKPGDIISFKSTDLDSHGDIITHKIRALTTDINGNPGFITYGTTTNADDTQIVSYSHVVGKYIFALPNLGKVLAFLKTPVGYLLFIFLPVGIIAVFQAINSIKLYKLYRAGESGGAKEIKSQRELQSQKNKDILEELMRAKAQLEAELSHMQSSDNNEVNNIKDSNTKTDSIESDNTQPDIKEETDDE